MTESIDNLIKRYPVLGDTRGKITGFAEILAGSFSEGHKLLVCGNGGSAADAEHFTAELMKSFRKRRALKDDLAKKLIVSGGERGKWIAERLNGAFPVISLASQTGILTAVLNDISPDLIFAQQVAGYGKAGDVLLAISTSGNSQNVIDAAITARALNMKVIALTGISGGKLKEYADLLVNVPSDVTHEIQELHLPIYHTVCSYIEDTLFQ
jgi:D-sedoheptulose 7-phosphate isomerase